MWGRPADTIPTFRARHTTWVLAHKADALAAAGDSAGVRALIEPVRSFGRVSGYGRDNRLHHHVRGLLLEARGRREEAMEEFRRAIWSPTSGYTRTNLELARLLLALGRPREAIPVLRAALAGSLQSSQLYVTHTELRALLGQAYAELGLADSAAAQRRWVARAIAGADPEVRERIAGEIGR
jgi:tetratricopeptide (TPR) repeat protein